MRGYGCIERPAFPAPSELQKAGNSGKTRAKSRGEIAKLCPGTAGCLKIESIMAVIARSASDEILSVVIPGWSEGPDLRCAIAHRGISRFRARCFASPRNDGFWIASRSLSSGALCADLLERNDGLNTPGVSVGYFSKQYRSPRQSPRFRSTPSHASPVS
jgi:hypothetical protein